MPCSSDTQGHRRRGDTETRWPATLALVLGIALYVLLPDPLLVGPRWVIPSLEASILIPLAATAHWGGGGESGRTRAAAIVLLGLANVANIWSLSLLLHQVVAGSHVQGKPLLLAAIEIWLNNVVIFGVWYWELDRGGPVARLRDRAGNPDFLFPQMVNAERTSPGWRPLFFDYLYVSVTNATAFSPTDTMPLSLPAKGLMGIQALTSLLTVALIAARAVNILA